MTDKEREDFIKKWKAAENGKLVLTNSSDWKVRLEADILDYESPITLIAKEMETKMEGDVMNVVQQYGINVNKEELLKALMYDRDQYAKGYADGRRDFERPKGEWKEERKYYSDVLKNIIYECSCSRCNARFPFAQIPETTEEAYYSFEYCPSCGAYNRSEDNDG